MILYVTQRRCTTNFNAQSMFPIAIVTRRGFICDAQPSPLISIYYNLAQATHVFWCIWVTVLCADFALLHKFSVEMAERM